MLHKTKGIVLHFIKYSETSIIVKIYTELFGIQSYIVNGVRSKNNKNKIALYQPLTLLDMVVYYKTTTSLNRISEIRCSQPYQSIPFEMNKSCVALFLSEVLLKVLKEETPNQELFDFLFHSFVALDTIENPLNFHIQFLIRLIHFIGFYSSDTQFLWDQTTITFSDELNTYLNACADVSYIENIHANNLIRRDALNIVLDYYKNHIENFGSLNTIQVIKELYK
jgi:DNA repair protein RecO (recombination protein O)